MNIFQEMVLSVYSFKSYREFLKNKKLKVFCYGIVFMMIYFFLTMILPFAEAQIRYGGINGGFQENIPDFELRNGRLWVARAVEYESAAAYVYIDTDPNSFFYEAYEMEDYLRGYRSAVLMDSEKMIVKSNGQVQGIYFSELDVDFGKEDLMRLIPYVYVGIGAMMIFVYLWETALYFFGVLFVALLGMIVASCMKCRLTFGQLYLLGIYSRTLPLLVKGLLELLPFGIPLYFIANFGLSVLIIGCAINRIQEQEKTAVY